MALTPMMQQYFAIKENYQDCILFYRLGDFYEMFFDDAELASKELELVLTGRDCGLEERAPMCGIPYHAASSYIGRLIQKGYKVAICEQVEDAKLAKGIVKREVVRIITPGTLLDENYMDHSRNNYIMAVAELGENYGLAFCDLSTGEFQSTFISKKRDALDHEFLKFSPKEVVVTDVRLGEYLHEKWNVLINERLLEDVIDSGNVQSYFKSVSGGYNAIVASASSLLLGYLEETQKTALTNLTHLEIFQTKDAMSIDLNTKKNLELTENIVDKTKKGSLLWVLDETATAMGSRNLRRWIDAPLVNPDMISKRLDAVETIYNHIHLMEDLREALKGVYDMERIVSKIALKSVNPKELLSLKSSLSKLPSILELLETIDYGELSRLSSKFDTLVDLYELLDQSILEEATMTLKDGNIIKDSFDEEIQRLREIKHNGKRWIAELEAKEREFTGIKSLKIGYNRVFGYYIEITKSQYQNIPEGRYVRKQTLANAERFITEDLKIMEDEILGADEKLLAREHQVFINIRDLIEKEIDRLKQSARIIADIDCYQCLAKVARDENYVKPKISKDGRINVIEGRHPVVEKMMQKGEFVSNNLTMNPEDQRFLIITGPNMAGKSTYMRQVALICLMTQIGSFVPAKEASIPISDRIFTRIGASDDLAGGKSTFMVEMSEVSDILMNATKDSLIILDEVGRGTSTYDGLSIAWAVIEHILTEISGAKTLFATHYHELTALEGQLDGVKNYSVLVKEVGKSIAFLRKIVPGGADQSYGIEVARLAGLPKHLLARAKNILHKLENKDKLLGEKPKKQISADEVQLGFFDTEKETIIEELRDVDLLTMNPMEAFDLLRELAKKVKEMI